ncbi:amino acid ABC transporter permease [Actinobacteria bacterium YIM 96077]|uniref:Amino acid ABC transporter permease n=1 Tax=Phytoactinopolyspora halophila TaxID=1981511 RepID=A0A329R448_9ACTN|nr:amino acid ABC transporter permease [Phytoactinopolyspora halophila]AYY11999.1 amino acid ABC transporter permease [Actinobacteria bacterium YIM 96077]RAW18766.1 amino acid ABC transporter permease [Phytoactinopolyspora halophila]
MDRLERLGDLLFNVEIIVDTLPVLFTEGLLITLIISVGGMLIGLVAGTVLAMIGVSQRWWVRLPSRIFVDLFRGLPAILVIFLVGFGLPAAGFRPFGREVIAYATLALGIIATAYVTEILRAGIQSVDKGQMEAARSLGMSRLEALWLVVVPQGFRRVLPPLTNEFIALTKDSSLVFILGLTLGERDLFRIGQQTATQTGNMSGLIAAGLFYLAITIPLTRIVNYMDTRMREGRPVAAKELPTTAEVS